MQVICYTGWAGEVDRIPALMARFQSTPPLGEVISCQNLEHGNKDYLLQIRQKFLEYRHGRFWASGLRTRKEKQSGGEVFSDLSRRGQRGVRFVVSDDHHAKVRANKRHFQDVLWQRRQVHFVRNILAHTAARDKEAILAQLRANTEAPTLTAARKAIGEAVDDLARRAPRAASWPDEHGEEILAVHQLPEAHRKRMRPANMLERVNQEIKRRTRVIRIFPNEQALLLAIPKSRRAFGW